MRSRRRCAWPRASERPFTLEELQAAEQAREHAQIQRDEQDTAYVKTQRRVTLTAADLQPDRRTLTVREAYGVIVDVGGTIDATDLGFRISVPERYGSDDGTDIGARERVREAARLLDQARDLVRDRLQSGRPLPDEPPPIGGG